MKKISSMSPQIQNSQMDMQAQQPAMDEEDTFKQLFTETAYKSFTGKFPFLMEYIKDFKILKADPEKGSAIGVFVLHMQGTEDVFLVPVILANNSLQPILFIYYQKEGVFLPLNHDWFNEIQKKSEESLGDVVKPPMDVLQANNSITQITSMPRYHGMANMIGKVASEQLSPINIPEVMSKLSNERKKEFVSILNKNEKIATYMFGRFGVDTIKKALQEKIAVAIDESPKLTIATPETPKDVIKKEFGKDHVVMDDITLKGYSIKDERDTKNKILVYTDYLNQLENPANSGVYEIYMSEGKTVPVLVLQDPILIDSIYPVDKEKQYKSYQVIAKNRALLLFPDGNYSIVKNDNVLSCPTLAEALGNSDLYKFVYGDKTIEVPMNKPFIFLKKTGNGYVATGPINVSKITTDDGDVRCITDMGSTIIYSDKYKGKNVYVTKDNTIFVPAEFKVVPLKEEVSASRIIGSMKTIMMLTNYRLIEKGGKPLTIVKDDKSNYGVETNRPVRKYEAIEKVARQYDINAKEVEDAFNEMDKIGSSLLTVYVLPKTLKLASLFEKEAQGQMDPQMMQQMMLQQQMLQGQGQQQQMPQQQQMDPQMMQQMMDQQGQAPQGQPQQEQMDPSQMLGQMPQQGPMDPSQMQAGAELSDQFNYPDMFDISSLMSMAYVSKLDDILPKYIPNLIQALDNLARILLNFWMNTNDLQDEIGLIEFQNIEMKIKNLFTNLGELLLTLNKKIDILSHK